VPNTNKSTTKNKKKPLKTWLSFFNLRYPPSPSVRSSRSPNNNNINVNNRNNRNLSRSRSPTDSDSDDDLLTTNRRRTQSAGTSRNYRFDCLGCNPITHFFFFFWFLLISLHVCSIWNKFIDHKMTYLNSEKQKILW